MAKATKTEEKVKECPISKEDFMENAKPLTLSIDGTVMTADLKEFKSGAFGFYAGGPVTKVINGVPVKFQVGFNMTAFYSKDA